jgi:hypothetical protein
VAHRSKDPWLRDIVPPSAVRPDVAGAGKSSREGLRGSQVSPRSQIGISHQQDHASAMLERRGVPPATLAGLYHYVMLRLARALQLTADPDKMILNVPPCAEPVGERGLAASRVDNGKSLPT